LPKGVITNTATIKINVKKPDPYKHQAVIFWLIIQV
jgi:hypothetical protein